MSSLSENMAMAEPWKVLPHNQQAVLMSIDPMKTLRVKNGWLVRGQKITKKVIDQLEARDLVKEQVIYGRERLKLTLAGEIAAKRLEDRKRERANGAA